MRLWFCLYLLGPITVGVLLNEYKNDIFKIIRTIAKFESSRNLYNLLIFVPSARGNFNLRSAIRSSWSGQVVKNTTLNSRVLVKFVVGKEPCHVPPADRLDIYSCNKWNINITNKETEKGANISAVDQSSTDVEPSSHRIHGIQTISFLVHHPVVITKLGVHQDSLGTRTKIKLLERTTQREIVSALLTKESTGKKIGSFQYRTVTPYFLPKGFEGIVVAENLASGNSILPVDSLRTGLNTIRNNGSGVLQFLEEEVLPEGHYYELRRWKSRGVDIVSFIYNIEEVEPLRRLIDQRSARQSSWNSNCSVESQQLDEESNEFDDILFVDNVDVYRNVPLKFLHFAQWAVENVKFNFLLKTDDDCFVDVERVLARVASLGDAKNTWLGRFRHNWIVERRGKWAEPSYPAILYPKFACGSGYVLSFDLVDWIAKNTGVLKPYQGEDVSMGIWLAAVGPNYIDEPLWQCEKDCLSDMYTEPDLRTDEIQDTWSNLQKCADPCGCN